MHSIVVRGRKGDLGHKMYIAHSTISLILGGHQTKNELGYKVLRHFLILDNAFPALGPSLDHSNVEGTLSNLSTAK
jgi:hypothetical protein